MSKTTNALVALGVVAGLGAAALPLSSYAANDKTNRDVPVELTIEPILQIATSNDNESEGAVTVDKVELTTANATDGAEYASTGFNVNVKTNNSKGYTISMMGTDGKTDLISGTDKIETGSLVAGTSAWAFKVTPAESGAGAGASTQTAWTNIPDASTVIYTGTQEKGGIDSTNGINTPITFGATVASTQAAGTYTGSVTFTAAAQN